MEVRCNRDPSDNRVARTHKGVSDGPFTRVGYENANGFHIVNRVRAQDTGGADAVSRQQQKVHAAATSVNRRNQQVIYGRTFGAAGQQYRRGFTQNVTYGDPVPVPPTVTFVQPPPIPNPGAPPTIPPKTRVETPNPPKPGPSQIVLANPGTGTSQRFSLNLLNPNLTGAGGLLSPEFLKRNGLDTALIAGDIAFGSGQAVVDRFNYLSEKINSGTATASEQADHFILQSAIEETTTKGPGQYKLVPGAPIPVPPTVTYVQPPPIPNPGGPPIVPPEERVETPNPPKPGAVTVSVEPQATFFGIDTSQVTDFTLDITRRVGTSFVFFIAANIQPELVAAYGQYQLVRNYINVAQALLNSNPVTVILQQLFQEGISQIVSSIFNFLLETLLKNTVHIGVPMNGAFKMDLIRKTTASDPEGAGEYWNYEHSFLLYLGDAKFMSTGTGQVFLAGGLKTITLRATHKFPRGHNKRIW